jgi:hypothetical protein
VLKHILIAMLAVCTMVAGSAEAAEPRAYSLEKITVNFPRMAHTPVQFLECRKRVCMFEAGTPLASVLLLADEAEKNIGMLSITFHSSKAQLVPLLIKDALRFAQYPSVDAVNVAAWMKSASASGKDIEVQKGLGAKLINLTSIDKNVFSFRFYRTGE